MKYDYTFGGTKYWELLDVGLQALIIFLSVVAHGANGWPTRWIATYDYQFGHLVLRQPVDAICGACAWALGFLFHFSVPISIRAVPIRDCDVYRSNVVKVGLALDTWW